VRGRDRDNPKPGERTMLGSALRYTGTVLFVTVVVSLVAGVVLGQPVLLSFVETDSMEPTIDAGDGFVALPTVLWGEPTTGDIVVFEAETIEGGGLTTHRIVDETDEGFITRGDGNPFTDQDGGEPPVAESQIVATVPQAGDSPLVIPFLGTAIQTVQGAVGAVVSPVVGVFGLDGVSDGTVGTGLFGAGLTLLVVSFVFEWRSTDRGRSRERRQSTASSDGFDTRLLAVLLVLVVLVPANAAMMLAGDTTEVTVDGEAVAEAEEVTPGDSIEADLNVRNSGLITVLTMLEPTGETDEVTLEPNKLAVPSGGTGAATATLPAPPSDADRTVRVEQHRYLLLMPEGVLADLHDRNPLLALGALNAFIGTAVAGTVWGLFGFGRIRERTTGRAVPLAVRLRRRFL
jgi:signal peptidase